MNAKKMLFVAGMAALVSMLSSLASAQYVEPPAEAKEAFFRACSTGDMKSLIPLVEANPSLVWVHREYDGKTGLHVAAMNGKNDAVKFLIKKGADPNAKDYHKHTPVYDAWRTPYPGTVRLLIKAGGRWSGR